MALIPNRTSMERGTIGAWANMEEDNARTAFAGSSFAAAVPVMKGSSEMVYVPLTTGNRFAGIALSNIDMQGTPTGDGAATFASGDLFGIADMGTVFVLAGDDVTEGASVYYEPSTRKFHGSSDDGLLPLPTCEFDESAANGQPVALRIRVLPGAAVVTVVST